MEELWRGVWRGVAWCGGEGWECGGSSRQDLSRKLDALRMMCVSNRRMARPVDVLAGIAGHLYDFAQIKTETEVLRQVGDLLSKSDALALAVKENVAATFSAMLTAERTSPCATGSCC